MQYIIFGFIFGLFIPYLARRIGKLIPAASGYILLHIFIPSHAMPWAKLKKNEAYMELFKRYVMRSIGWAVFTAAATVLFVLNFDNVYTWWYITFLWILLLLAEIDKRFMLLPDILTLPLLLLGFAYASLQGFWLVLPEPNFMPYALNSALGAISGYVLPLAASLFVIWKHPQAFGDGDLKLLAAIGAWVGFASVPYILLGACALFSFEWLINRQKIGPFGPAIIYATLIFVIFFFAAL
ncbi:MAG: prepilin peptidase [Alphaproteobacteria bacterium]|nr:prepilin peptidase [Alphaproteobacteria bacterium]